MTETKQILYKIMCLCCKCADSKTDFVVEFDTRKTSIELRIFYEGWDGTTQRHNKTDYIIAGFEDLDRLKVIFEKLEQLNIN